MAADTGWAEGAVTRRSAGAGARKSAGAVAAALPASGVRVAAESLNEHSPDFLRTVGRSDMAMGRRHRSWTAEETEQLRAHIARGGSAARAAVIFKRTEGAMRAHANACGLKFPTINQLRRRALGSPPHAAP